MERIKPYIAYLVLISLSYSCSTVKNKAGMSKENFNLPALDFEGTYQSISSQLGFSDKEELSDYVIEVKADTISLFYKSASVNKEISIYIFNLKREGNLIYIDCKLIKGNNLYNWFNGMVTYDKRKKILQFSNGIEVDGGPLTIWQRI
ncbi:MAG: hypothetical protein O9340_07280 [Cyclobacteriaceae bacterium]|jgi:hypothetical protein|nr:hypothetical protein [Cyclobacteriaceae bacterium]